MSAFHRYKVLSDLQVTQHILQANTAFWAWSRVSTCILTKMKKPKPLGYFFRLDKVADAWRCARILIGAAKEVGSRNIRVNAVSEILFTNKQSAFSSESAADLSA